jgi:hypothetical protein
MRLLLLLLAATAAMAASFADVEQKVQGEKPPAEIVASFDGLGYGFVGPQGNANLRNPSDNSLAVGPDHIMQTVNSRTAIFTKKGKKFDTTGKVLYGPVNTSNFFRGFGGPCEVRNNGDAVVRYDQLANRWLVVMPLFSRNKPGPRLGIAGEAAKLFEPPTQTPTPLPFPPPQAGPPAQPGAPAAQRPPSTDPYAMCYAISTGPDPFGTYYRYEFTRPLFPDYPRPAVWPDGYYTPTSTGDDVIEKHVCVVERSAMLAGKPAREHCIIVKDVNFLNTSDLDGSRLPPRGAPNIVIAAGGTQLRNVLGDDGVYVWNFHVDWKDTTKTRLDGPTKITVEPYKYLCGGQLTSCVPQPGTERKLDAQGDKIMARSVYRRLSNRETLVAVHSVNTSMGGGGVRWYEFTVNRDRTLALRQQGTFAPDSFYRWMASPATTKNGDIGIGYSFGGTPHFAGQRFAGRAAGDPLGRLTLHEAVLAHGEAAQTNTLRWEDYTQTAMDPSDDCTIWYVGDYLKKDAPNYSSRIGAFRLPGCR